ncbi:hypothetical protein [Sphingomonas mollis]|uniref:Uncharacterized protein n=1 Tax=Sphingomonas mollis TaxID=2795726 RepID=A0ABS0XRM9_9SPHN|nr:hypothetical protein [Sphingomonas sp. BT553]MBJ6122693.1 hypothetical protein [Sphingomonas sp. BT553]
MFVVYTALSKPSKDKIVVCVGNNPPIFFWVNTDPRFHGIGQMRLSGNDHTALTHDCYLDCSRVTTFPAHELRAARQRDPITTDLADAIVKFLETEQPATLPSAQRESICQVLREHV